MSLTSDWRTSARIRGRKRITALYYRWLAMRARCENPRNTAFAFYGGRGIRVCREWRDYGAFRAWALSNGFHKNLTLDRIDPNSDYQPENCRWVDRLQQGATMRKNIMLELDGKRLHLREWARQLGISHQTISRRLKQGRPMHEVLSKERL